MVKINPDPGSIYPRFNPSESGARPEPTYPYEFGAPVYFRRGKPNIPIPNLQNGYYQQFSATSSDLSGIDSSLDRIGEPPNIPPSQHNFYYGDSEPPIDLSSIQNDLSSIKQSLLYLEKKIDACEKQITQRLDAISKKLKITVPPEPQLEEIKPPSNAEATSPQLALPRDVYLTPEMQKALMKQIFESLSKNI